LAGTLQLIESGVTGSSTARIAHFAIPRGADGDAANITKDGVLGVFIMNNPGGTSFVVRPSTATGQTNSTELITIGDLQGFKRWIATATSQTNYHSDGVTKSGFSNYSGVVTIW